MASRVASLIPSGTEIVSALGMADTLVGRSHCCDWPPEVLDLPELSRPKVDPRSSGAEIDRVVREIMASGASVYDILMEPLLAAAPDVVITQDHCDACAVSLAEVREAVACAELAGASVCALHPHDLGAVCLDFLRVADALGVPDRGRRLADRFEERLRALRDRLAQRRPVRVVLVEWLEPPMIAGGWIPELARAAGLDPLIVRDSSGFVEVGWPDIEAEAPDAVVLLPCGFTVERTVAELGCGVLEEGAPVSSGPLAIPLRRRPPQGVWVVDGDALFNRPGPRLADSAELLAWIFHAEASGVDAAPLAGAFARVG